MPNVLKELNKDALFCVKEYQDTILESMVQTFADADFIRETWNVLNGRTLLWTVREVWKDGTWVSRQKRYFISSLEVSQVSPERFLKWVQGHGQIENR